MAPEVELAERQVGGQRRRLDARDGPDLRDEPSHEGTARGLVVPAEPQIDGDDHATLDVEPGIDGQGVAQAAQEQAGARQEHERQRHLGHDERALRPEDAAHLAQQRGGFLEGGVLALAERLKGRRQAEHEGARQGRERTEPRRPPVDPRVDLDRHLDDRRLQHRPQRVDRPGRGEQAARARDDRDEHALGQQLPQEPSARRAERVTQRDLPPAIDGRGEIQVGDVQAGHEQHETHHHEDDRHGPLLRIGRVEQADAHAVGLDQPEPPVPVRVGALTGELDGHRVGGALGRGEVLAILEAAGQNQPRVVPVLERDRKGQRLAERRHGHPDVRRDDHVRRREAIGRDADHGERVAVDEHRAAEHLRIRAEPPGPQTVADDRHGVSLGQPILLAPERPAERRSHAHHVEVVGAGKLAEDHLGRAVHAHAHRKVEVGRDPVERRVAFGQRHVVRVRRVAQIGAALVRGEDADQGIGIGDGERAVEERVGDPEHGHVGPDAERQRDDGHHGGGAAPQQKRPRETDVADEAVHEVPPGLDRSDGAGPARPNAPASMQVPFRRA